MTDPYALADRWRRLYDLAIRLKELAPWRFMIETDVFAVQDPHTGELGFVSIMGSLGEHFAAAVYRGARGLYAFWNGQDDPDSVAEQVLEIPHLQLAFEDRDDLDAEDHSILEELGLHFQGPKAWPQFRAYRPGFLPWYLDAREMRFFTAVLEQVLEVMPRLRDGRVLEPDPIENRYLVRVCARPYDPSTWRDEIIEVPPPEPHQILIHVEPDLLGIADALPHRRHEIEADFFRTPILVNDAKEGADRPYFPYLLMVVDGQNGMILGGEMFSPAPTLEEMWGRIPQQMVREFTRCGFIPEHMSVRSPLLATVLQPLAERLGFAVDESDVLPQLDPAKAAAMRHFTS